MVAWVPKKEYVGSSKAGEYGDFTRQVDAAVGELLKVLKEKGIEKNTMVIFTSDNGPYWRENFTEQFQHRAAGPFRGMKGDAYEGGHRIPFIVRWPEKIKKGTVSDAIACQTSLLSTLRDLLSDKDPKFDRKDSYSILPDLLSKTNPSNMEKPIIHSSSKGYLGIRLGDWKLIDQLGSGGFTAPDKENPTPGGPRVQLYNLKSDPMEKENVALKYPEKTTELLAKLAEIKKQGGQFKPDYLVSFLFFVTFGDYIYFRYTLLLITPFSMKIPVNIGPGSWSVLFFLLIIKYEIFTKICKEPISCGFYTWTDGYRKKPNTNVLNMETND